MAQFQGLRDRPDRLIADIEALEQRAHKLGMTLTAQALNRAKNATGWSLAGDPDKAAAAMRGEH